jgi:hypothetical protein
MRIKRIPGTRPQTSRARDRLPLAKSVVEVTVDESEHQVQLADTEARCMIKSEQRGTFSSQS